MTATTGSSASSTSSAQSTSVASPAVRIEDVSKRFRIYKNRNQSLKGAFLQRSRAQFEEFWALSDVSFDIPQGKTFGLLGHNGSGKSTLLKCIAKILAPNSGTITAREGATVGRSGMASMPGAAAPVVVQPVAVDPLVEPVAEPDSADPDADSDSAQADGRRGKDSEGGKNRKKEQK